MDFSDAVKHALDGDALLFMGSGFAVGARNLRNAAFPMGRQFAALLASRAGLPSETDLDDAAEAFLESHGDDELIKEISENFTTSSVASHHRQFARVPWRRVYTTNYDDVLETAFKAESRALTSVTLSDDPYRIPKEDIACIHLNGYAGRLDRDALGEELKLTESSYLTASLEDSPWIVLFRQDLKLARACFFVGYSLYDLDIKRLLFATEGLRDKCFFALLPGTDAATIRRASRLGSVLTIGTEGMAAAIADQSRTYEAPDRATLQTFLIHEHRATGLANAGADRDFIDMLLLGRYKREHVSESIVTGHQFYLERTQAHDVFQFSDDGHRVVVVCSDLGNGKTMFLEGLRQRALERGFRVFEVGEKVSGVEDELQRIAGLSGKVLVTIEEYQNWLSEIRGFCLNASDRALLVLTARSAVHDVVFEDLLDAAGLESVPELRLDKLGDREVAWVVDVLNHYGLWGDKAGLGRAAKTREIEVACQREFHAVLLSLLRSPDIGGRLVRVFRTSTRTREFAQLITSILVLESLNLSPSPDILVDLWGSGTLADSKFRRDPGVRQIIDFARNEVIVKSSVASQYLLQEVADGDITREVMVSITRRANALRAFERYRRLLASLMKFAAIQNVFPQFSRAVNVIRYYEAIKGLDYCAPHPLFWLQYAIACLVAGQLDRAAKYFDTAYSLAREKDWDTYQIDNHYARYLLLSAMEVSDSRDVMPRFRSARNIINRQVKEERRHYPYRVACAYQDLLDRFDTLLSTGDVAEIGRAANFLLRRIAQLPELRQQQRYVVQCRDAMQYVCERVRELSPAASLEGEDV